MLTFEPNDTMAQAQTLSEGIYNISGVGHDWYRIASGPGTITIDMLPAIGTDVNMVLYNAQGQAIAANISHSGTGREIITYQSTTNTDYFADIFPNAGTASSYTLSVDVPNKTWATTLPFGPIRDASVALYDIDGDGRDEIFVGTSKAIDAAGNEVRPAGFVCLDDDGSVRWSSTFPGMSTPDPITGKTYNTTSVSGAPLFTDVDGDGQIDIVVSVGGDNRLCVDRHGPD
jgi:hypothetical protein